CPQGVYLPGRMELYVRVSAEVHEIFREFTPDIQPLSLDEAFLDVGGSMHFFDGPRALAAALKRRVKDELRLNVSVGIASSKLVAKIACTMGKPDGMWCVEPGAEREFLAPLPIRRLWGIGPVTAEKLRGLGIERIGDLAEYSPERLTSVLGRRAGQLQEWARGVDLSVVEGSRVPKSCGEESTFGSDVLD